jgi:tol-pal system protein YbgF
MLIAPLLAVIFAVQAVPAQAQFDNRGLADRIDRIERDLQMMQGQVARGAAGANGATVITSPALGGGTTARSAGGQTAMPSGLAVRLDERVDELENLVRQLTGRVEEASYRATQANKLIEKLQADIDARFRDLQGGGQNNAAQPSQPGPAGNGQAPTLTPPKGADAPGPAPGPQTLGSMSEKDMKKLTPPAQAQVTAKTPEAQYEDAYAAAQRGDFANAEKGFAEFLSKNPKHQLAGNASYWMGDIAYTRKDYDTAARTFLESYKQYPKHSKAPDMIYKAGSAFGQQGKTKEACVAFSILFKDHPKMPDRVKRAAAAEQKKYGCK